MARLIRITYESMIKQWKRLKKKMSDLEEKERVTRLDYDFSTDGTKEETKAFKNWQKANANLENFLDHNHVNYFDLDSNIEDAECQILNGNKWYE